MTHDGDAQLPPALPDAHLEEGIEPITAEEIGEATADLGDDLAADDQDVTAEERAQVEGELDGLRGLVQGMTLDDLRQGDWFVSLLKRGVSTYASQVDAGYFQQKYPHLGPDAIADARIRLASRYAAVAGGLTASAYSGAVAATIGSAGGASPLTVPAAVSSFALDLAYSSQAQLRLAYDMSVIYGAPLDLSDSEDLWKLVRIAFGIKAGEAATGAVLKSVPAVLRPLIKKTFSGSTLAAVKSLPVVGKHLLQRNIIKFSIPGVTIPVSSAVNFWTTKTSGEYARSVFRTEATVVEEAAQMTARTDRHPALLRVLWLVAHSDGKVSEAEGLVLHHVSLRVDDTPETVAVLDEQRTAVVVDEDAVWRAVEAAPVADRRVLLDAARWVAEVDGRVKRQARPLLQRLEELAEVEPGDDAQGRTAAAAQAAADTARRGIGAIGRLGRSIKEQRDDRALARADRIRSRRTLGAGMEEGLADPEAEV